MKKVFLFILASLLLLAACSGGSSNEPVLTDQQKAEMILGKWEAHDKISGFMFTVDFDNNGHLLYWEKPDPDAPIQMQVAPRKQDYAYQIVDGKLAVSYLPANPFEDSYDFTTDFAISDSTLWIEDIPARWLEKRVIFKKVPPTE